MTDAPVPPDDTSIPVRVRAEIAALPPYKQGKQAEAGGFKLSSNENPFDPLPGVVEAVQASGACVMTPTVWQGEPGMRISVSNWQTTEADVERSVAAIREVMARLQPTSST